MVRIWDLIQIRWPELVGDSDGIGLDVPLVCIFVFDGLLRTDLVSHCVAKSFVVTL